MNKDTIKILDETPDIDLYGICVNQTNANTKLREELNKQLDEMLYSRIAEVDKGMVENMDAIVGKTPLKIFVG